VKPLAFVIALLGGLQWFVTIRILMHRADAVAALSFGVSVLLTLVALWAAFHMEKR